MEEYKLTTDNAMEAVDILRDMLESEMRINELLRRKIRELQYDIPFPDYVLWHDTWSID